jgi:hypothetical protein
VVDAVRKQEGAQPLDRAGTRRCSGVLDAERLKNPNYYRHVVLDYARAEAAAARVAGVGKKLRSPRWAKAHGVRQGHQRQLSRSRVRLAG